MAAPCPARGREASFRAQPPPRLNQGWDTGQGDCRGARFWQEKPQRPGGRGLCPALLWACLSLAFRACCIQPGPLRWSSSLCPADSHKQLEHLEATKSSLKNELVLTKEALSHATLQKEVLEEEKAKAAEALAKARRPLEVQAREGAGDVLGPLWLD